VKTAERHIVTNIPTAQELEADPACMKRVDNIAVSHFLSATHMLSRSSIALPKGYIKHFPVEFAKDFLFHELLLQWVSTKIAAPCSSHKDRSGLG
jgi:hypothetical protein